MGEKPEKPWVQPVQPVVFRTPSCHPCDLMAATAARVGGCFLAKPCQPPRTDGVLNDSSGQ